MEEVHQHIKAKTWEMLNDVKKRIVFWHVVFKNFKVIYIDLKHWNVRNQLHDFDTQKMFHTSRYISITS